MFACDAFENIFSGITRLRYHGAARITRDPASGALVIPPILTRKSARRSGAPRAKSRCDLSSSACAWISRYFCWRCAARWCSRTAKSPASCRMAPSIDMSLPPTREPTSFSVRVSGGLPTLPRGVHSVFSGPRFSDKRLMIGKAFAFRAQNRLGSALSILNAEHGTVAVPEIELGQIAAQMSLTD
jgi:hypothetical protein